MEKHHKISTDSSFTQEQADDLRTQGARMAIQGYMDIIYREKEKN